MNDKQRAELVEKAEEDIVHCIAFHQRLAYADAYDIDPDSDQLKGHEGISEGTSECAHGVMETVTNLIDLLLTDRAAILRLEYERGYQEAKSETPIHTYASTGNRAAMNKNDLVRELEKIGDVLNVTNTHFQSEARMNAALHMSENVRPAPLAAAVQTACTSLDVLVQDILDNGLKGDS